MWTSLVEGGVGGGVGLVMTSKKKLLCYWY